MGRRVQNVEQIGDNQKVLLSQIDYNEVGQMKAKYLHAANGMENIWFFKTSIVV